MVYETTPTSQKKIRDHVKGYMIPRIKTICDNLRKRMQTVVGRKLHLRHGVVTDVVFENNDTETVANTTVPGENHTHSATEVDGVALATDSGLVKRNDKGKIIGSGSVYGNTGFKLANGQDISTLFRNKAEYPVTVENKTTGSGTFITALSLSATQNADGSSKLTLNKTMGSLCPTYRYPDITVDGCH